MKQAARFQTRVYGEDDMELILRRKIRALAAKHPKRQFNLGRIVATYGALDALRRSGDSPARLLVRHASGDYGDMPPEDVLENRRSLQTGARIMSAYRLRSGVKIWLITEAVGDDGERSATTFLLPEEY